MAVAFLVGLAVTAAPAPQAEAATPSANGCSYWVRFTLPSGYQIPAGGICHQIYGSGLNVTSQTASWFPIPSGLPMCNTRIDFTYYDQYGRLFYRFYGTLHPGCNNISGSQYRGPGKLAQGGLACAVIVSSGTDITRQCHNTFA
ncbi:hypothetical protein GCM10027517_11990 [Phycicoccus ginsengisoli]